jgi:hypothetical protein
MAILGSLLLLTKHVSIPADLHLTERSTPVLVLGWEEGDGSVDKALLEAGVFILVP